MLINWRYDSSEEVQHVRDDFSLRSQYVEQ